MPVDDEAAQKARAARLRQLRDRRKEAIAGEPPPNPGAEPYTPQSIVDALDLKARQQDRKNPLTDNSRDERDEGKP